MEWYHHALILVLTAVFSIPAVFAPSIAGALGYVAGTFMAVTFTVFAGVTLFRWGPGRWFGSAESS